MRIKIALVAALLLAALSPAQAQNTKSALTAQVAATLPDNTSGQITPSGVRTLLDNFVSSWQQYASVNAQVGTSYTFQASDYGQLVTFNNSSAISAALPQPLGSFVTWNTMVSNLGSGLLTITPSGSTINSASSFVLAKNQSIQIVSDGTNYQVRFGYDPDQATATAGQVPIYPGGGLPPVAGQPSSVAGGVYVLSHATGSWICRAPDGTTVSTFGTTTSGLQECVTAMQTTKTGHFQANCGPGTTLAASTTVTFGPSIGYSYNLDGCSMTSTASGPAVQIDTFAQGTNFSWAGGYLHCQQQAGTTECVLIKPTNGDPLFGGKVASQSYYHFPYINTEVCSGGVGSLGDIFHINPNAASTSAFVNNIVDIDGLDGNAANFCANEGFAVDVPTLNANGYVQNQFRIGLITNYSDNGMLICNSSSSTTPCATNEYHVAVNVGSAITGSMIRTGGFLDLWFITSLSINTGSCAAGISFVGGGTEASPTGAYGNTVISGQIGCTTPISLGGSLMNSIINPGQGGAWAPFTPTVTCAGGTVTANTSSGRYSIIGHKISFSLSLALTTLSACTTGSNGAISATLPLKAAAGSVVPGRETASSGNMLQGIIPASSATISINRYDNTCPDCVSGRTMVISGAYEFQ